MQPFGQPQGDLEGQYKSLTPKQRAVVDAHAEQPDAKNREKCNKAIKLLKERVENGDVDRAKVTNNEGEISVNESYCSQLLNNQYPEVARYRAEILQNERQEGEFTTTGDPFSASPFDESENRGWQTWDERPNKDAAQADESNGESDSADDQRQVAPSPQQSQSLGQPVQVKIQSDGVLVKFDREYLYRLLQDPDAPLPRELHEQLVRQVVGSAFNSQAAHQ